MGQVKARLYCKIGALAGTSFAIEDELVVGRHPECSAFVEPVQMSNRHARIYFDAAQGRYFLEDLESLNGTQLDGESVDGVEPLGHLHVITFARRYDFIFQDLERCRRRHEKASVEPSAPAESSDAMDVERTRIDKLPLPIPAILEKFSHLADVEGDLALKETVGPDAERTNFQKIIPALPANLVRPASSLPSEEAKAGAAPAGAEEASESFEWTAERPPGLWLRVFAGDDEQAFPLPEGEHLVGREANAEIRPASQEISRRHARLTVRDERVTVEDLGSRNRTFVAGQAVDGQVEVPHGVELRFGSVVAQVVHTNRLASHDQGSDDRRPDDRRPDDRRPDDQGPDDS